MREIKAKILSNEKIAPGRFRIRLGAERICRDARPGQFVMVKCSKTFNPFLRRPFSFHRIEKKSFELLYQIIGKGTKILSQKKPGGRIDIIGPLGNGFDIDQEIVDEPLLIAGGIGIAPLLALARALKTNGLRPTVLLGAKTKSHVLCDGDFKKLGAKVEVFTEDGSRGHKGMATDLLKAKLRSPRPPRRNTIYACGPKGMLEETARIARSEGVPCQISFEEKMACGTGACLGCAVKTVIGYKMTCKDGPIFNAGDIIW